MRLIEPKAELLLQGSGLEGVYKQIELCGRTCYKSTDKMTEDSAKPFVDRMIGSHHTAMLEQGTVYLKVPAEPIEVTGELDIPIYPDPIDTLYYNPYSSCSIVDGFAYITTNLRVIIENFDESMQSEILSNYVCEPTINHQKRYTIKFITDRGVSHELVRHRVFSFAQESTRYCNYSKDKFGNELSFVKPSWYYSKKALSDGISLEFDSCCRRAEESYMLLISKGCTPKQARQILPNALKTEVCMTGFASDWRFFFDLRYYGETGKPHPDMELLASKAREEFIKAGLWDEIMSHKSKFDQ